MEDGKHLDDGVKTSTHQDCSEKDALRMLGNTAFRSKDFSTAEMHYTHCIEMQGGADECQTLALSNRQVLHMH